MIIETFLSIAFLYALAAHSRQSHHVGLFETQWPASSERDYCISKEPTVKCSGCGLPMHNLRCPLHAHAPYYRARRLCPIHILVDTENADAGSAHDAPISLVEMGIGTVRNDINHALSAASAQPPLEQMSIHATTSSQTKSLRPTQPAMHEGNQAETTASQTLRAVGPMKSRLFRFLEFTVDSI
ncbi:hypothetical protein HYPSUDRAFT_817720 [Hypholoma sublateritium FD-334 SS-4]|uniref:Uncharacterized protein n=1 Tax=Hypholoma sublateritium (strain FD-334 SS-4) TaxID=945553 RepID=A0A0D2L107_HYPSF|nr:hypothetical protein HYPSUDRAFT_817720 [Hypholoma sublateritium FD-334 SS-4]